MLKKAFIESMNNMEKYLAEHPAPAPEPAAIDSLIAKPMI
jgi:hypothetical protein